MNTDLSAGMTAREFLEQARHINIRIRSMRRQLAFLRDAARNITPNYSADKVRTTPNPHSGEDKIVRYLDLETKLKELYATLEDVNLVISGVADSYRNAVLVERYIRDKRWDEVAGELFTSESNVYKIHRAALADAEKILQSRRASGMMEVQYG